jgi:hypothetical protein
MLSVDEIKKGCEFSDGFEYFDAGRDWISLTYYGKGDETLYISSYLKNNIKYDLFLQRVIEGINEDIRFRIKQESNILDVYLCDDFGDIKSIKQIGGDSDDEAKEKAIKYILEKLD